MSDIVPTVLRAFPTIFLLWLYVLSVRSWGRIFPRKENNSARQDNRG